VADAIDSMSERVKEWHDQRFDNHEVGRIALKFGEEVGEVFAALLDLDGYSSTTNRLLDEVGDAVITLHGLLAYLPDGPYDLDEVVARRFEEVSQRD
jgi:NTP pyrophosphatase (non-canonical NTP hydrolase)